MAKSEEEFPPAIRSALDSYPKLRTGPEFEARFWVQLENRRLRYQGIVGLWRRFIEIEVEGVAVWRLAASTVSGGLFCALVLGLSVLLINPSTKPIANASTPVPKNEPRTAMNSFPLYAREWENGYPRLITPGQTVLFPVKRSIPKPNSHPRTSTRTSNGGEISCLDLNARSV